jgi:NCS1 family nucleobase:cation symporter-1
MPELNQTGHDGSDASGRPGDDLAAAVEGAPGTGSRDLVRLSIDTDLPDDADDVATGVPSPVPSPRVAETEAVIVDTGLQDAPARHLEATGPEPTPLPLRVGTPSRMFRLWFAVTASVVSVALGVWLVALGLTVPDVVLGTILGIVLSFIPLGLGTLAGISSGQPMMVLSRATFGVVGNIVPAVLAILVRVGWGGLLLTVAGQVIGAVAAPAGPTQEPVYGMVPALVGAFLVLGIAATAAIYGYAMVTIVQHILLFVSSALLALTIIMTWSLIDFPGVLDGPDSPGAGIVTGGFVTGGILVFAYLGLAWATSGADLARYQRPFSGGGRSMLHALGGAGLPALVLVCYGALLAASSPTQAAAFAVDPVGTVARLLPGWSGIPLLTVATVTLLSALIVNLYSGGLAFAAATRSVGRAGGVLLAAGGTGLVALVILLSRTALVDAFLALPLTLAVPVAAWAGLFSAEFLLRRRPLDSGSLLRRGGAYADWRWKNLVALVLISAIGFGLVGPGPGQPGRPGWLGWEGFLLGLPGTGTLQELGGSGAGVLVAFLLGLLTPLIFGIPAIRRQEDALLSHR